MLVSIPPHAHFHTQTKETLTLKPSAFGSKAEFDDKFFKKMMAGTSILDSILSFGQEKQNKVSTDRSLRSHEDMEAGRGEEGR